MRNPYGNSLSPANRSAETGSIAVPVLLLSIVLGGAAFSALGYSLLWRSKASLQLRLDRCVEKTAAELVSVQNAIEFGNIRMRVERAAAAAAAVPTFGASIDEAQPVLEGEVALQEVQRARWILRQARWIGERGCEGRSDLFLPLPNLKWSRPAMDPLGPQPLAWEGSEKLTIRLWKMNRFSSARVAGNSEKEEANAETAVGERLLGKWKAAWIRSGPSLD